MTLNRQDTYAAHVGVASRGPNSAGTFPRTACSQPRTARQEGLTLPPEWARLAGYLLAWTVPVVFCSGFVGLAVSSLFEVAVPRWVVLAHGIDCILVALLALLLTGPWQQPCHGKGEDANRDWAETWNGSRERDALERLPADRPLVDLRANASPLRPRAAWRGS
jgi:hypothetical protein